MSWKTEIDDNIDMEMESLTSEESAHPGFYQVLIKSEPVSDDVEDGSSSNSEVNNELNKDEINSNTDNQTQCSICKAVFTDTLTFDTHMRNHINNITGLECLICNTMENINFKFIYGELTGDEKLVQWLLNVGMIRNKYECEKCGEQMKLCKTSRCSDGFVWRCQKYGLNKHDVQRSVRKGSWFEESKLCMRDILAVTYMWTLKMSNESIGKDLGISQTTIVEWKSFCRDICVEMCVGENEILGGEGKIVEIDESKFGKRKYNKRKCVVGKWVFGGIERGTSKCFMCVVDDRSKDVLLDVIKKYILPGTTIISECWKSYDCLDDEGFKNQTVNHAIQFKNPDTVEGTWSAVKRGLLGTKHCVGQFDTYLFEYIWRRRHQKAKKSLINIFLEHVQTVYST